MPPNKYMSHHPLCKKLNLLTSEFIRSCYQIIVDEWKPLETQTNHKQTNHSNMYKSFFVFRTNGKDVKTNQQYDTCRPLAELFQNPSIGQCFNAYSQADQQQQQQQQLFTAVDNPISSISNEENEMRNQTLMCKYAFTNENGNGNQNGNINEKQNKTRNQNGNPNLQNLTQMEVESQIESNKTQYQTLTTNSREIITTSIMDIESTKTNPNKYIELYIRNIISNGTTSRQADVAAKLGMSTSALSKKWSKLSGGARWPHRALTALKRHTAGMICTAMHNSQSEKAANEKQKAIAKLRSDAQTLVSGILMGKRGTCPNAKARKRKSSKRGG